MVCVVLPRLDLMRGYFLRVLEEVRNFGKVLGYFHTNFIAFIQTQPLLHIGKSGAVFFEGLP